MSARTVSRSQAVLASAHVVRLLMSLAITVILGRGLAAGDFGFVGLVTSLFAIALAVLDMGTTAVATREVAARPEREREVLAAVLSFRRTLAAALLAILLVVALSGYVVHGKHRLVLVAAAVGVYVLYLYGYQVSYQVRQAYGRAVALGLLAQAGFIAASLAALAFKWAGAAIALLVVVREAAIAIAIRAVSVDMLGKPVDTPWRHPGVRALLAAGWLIGVAGACYKSATFAGGLFLWGLAAPEAVASFHAAQRIVLPATDLAWIFATPLLASMSAAFARNPATYRLQVGGHAKFAFAAGALVAVAGSSVAPFLLQLLYGDRYAGGPWSSVEVLRWMSLAALFGMAVPVLVMGEIAQGHARLLMRIGLVGVGVNAAVNAVAVRTMGAEGAAIALVCSEVVVFGTLAGRALLRGDLRLDASWIAYLAPAVLLGAACYALREAPVAQFTVACAWAPLSFLFLVTRPEQKACRASQPADDAWNAAKEAAPVQGPAAG